ncbi:MAG TPA: GGDEF domain-containing protein [Steroidobacteraceae bacterium]
MPGVASVSSSAIAGVARARSPELVRELRVAAMEGDEMRITHLLSELLRCKGLSRAQRIALQQKALLNLVASLRSAALNDDLTGLYNRRSFMQAGTRLLDLAARDQQPAHLVYFGIDQFAKINQSLGRSAGDILIRQTGNLLRDLFPSYGVYEVLGRLKGDEFAALTTSDRHASRQAIMLRVRRPERSSAVPTLTLSVGVARFNPQRPVDIDELLETARRAMNEPLRESALSELAPLRA